MKIFQLIDQDGDHIGLFTCPDSVSEITFVKALEAADFDMELFEDENTLGAERVFAEPVYIP